MGCHMIAICFASFDWPKSTVIRHTHNSAGILKTLFDFTIRFFSYTKVSKHIILVLKPFILEIIILKNRKTSCMHLKVYYCHCFKTFKTIEITRNIISHCRQISITSFYMLFKSFRIYKWIFIMLITISDDFSLKIKLPILYHNHL